MIVVDVATGFILVALGLAYRRYPPGVLLVGAGLAWFLGDIAAWAIYLHRGPLVHLVLSYPFRWPGTRLAWATVALAYLCAALPPLSTSGPATVAVAATLLGSAFYGYTVASGPLRAARLAALGAAVVLAVAMSAGTVLRLAGLAADSAVQLPYDVLIVVTAAWLCADLHRRRWARAAVTGLVVDLGQAGPLRTRLARAIGDPTLKVGFWLPAEQRYVDEAGRTVDIGRGVSHTFLEVDGERAGVLVHDTSVLADPALVAEVAAAARLAMANIGLREQVRARAAEVASSRRRLVESADAARRGLADDLRRGPERRLDRVAELLHGAAGGERAHGDLIAGLDRARAVLRDLVVGIHPPTLTTGGLPAALPELVQLANVPVHLTVEPGRYAADIEAAGYFVCSEALTNIARHAGASQAWIRISQHDGSLQIEIEDDGVGGARVGGGSGLRGLADRVAALGGTLSVESSPGSGTRLTAQLSLPGTTGPGQ
jgi:signal transduction histidine kinase